MKINQLLLTTALIAGIGACTNNKKTASSSLKHYVDSVNAAAPVYTEANWTVIDNDYQQRATLAAADEQSMSEADKKELEESRAKYAELKAKYDTELQKNRSVIESKSALRNSLFGAGNIGEDMDFKFVTSANMLSVYQGFVDAVEVNKEYYTREDWDEIKVLYEALDTHKNKDEKNLATEDNMKIAGLKLKFAGVYTTYRSGSKGKENAEAKS